MTKRVDWLNSRVMSTIIKLVDTRMYCERMGVKHVIELLDEENLGVEVESEGASFKQIASLFPIGIRNI